MLTAAEYERYEVDGAVTVDTPLTSEQVRAAGAAMDRILLPPAPNRFRASRTCDYLEPELLEIIQHPWFEAVAKQTLRADEVWFYQTAIINAYPQPGATWGYEQHVDIQYCLSDWEATPRRVICSFFLWLTDVNEKRAPMMVRPGSHWLLARWREENPETRGVPPAVAPLGQGTLPDLPYADPIPLLATAGQVSVLTTATVHGASTNVDDQPRQNLVITFVAAGQEIGLVPDQEAQKRAYDRELHARFRPERRHLIAPASR